MGAGVNLLRADLERDDHRHARHGRLAGHAIVRLYAYKRRAAGHITLGIPVDEAADTIGPGSSGADIADIINRSATIAYRAGRTVIPHADLSEAAA